MMISEKRRKFLKTMAIGGAGAALAKFPNIAMAETDGNTLNAEGYKALVCINLRGGNDSGNMIIPTNEDKYADYASLRGNLAIDKELLNPIYPLSSKDNGYGLHPSMINIQSIFNEGNAAILSNVGAMVDDSGRLAKPLRMASHKDQNELWSGVDPVNFLIKKQGWVGSLSDIVNDNNTLQNYVMNGSSNMMQSGVKSKPFSVPQGGPDKFHTLASDEDQELSDWLLNNHNDRWDRKEISSYTVKAKENLLALASHFDNEEVNSRLDALDTSYSSDSFGKGMKNISRIIASNNRNIPRQTFNIDMGGFDTHNNQLQTHNKLFGSLDQNISSLYHSLKNMGFGDDVIIYTISDFGRAYKSNGSGSGHGWGGHHMIIGDPVIGQHIYGKFPSMSTSSTDFIENKKILIPSTSIEQYMATLATWFGVPMESLQDIIPQIELFYGAKNLSFLTS